MTRTRRFLAITAACLIVLGSTHRASQATAGQPGAAEEESEETVSDADDWQAPRELDPLYERIAGDLRAGRPLVVASYYGMWHVRKDEPDRNLNWGVYYGHKTMLERAQKDGHIAKNYTHTDWKRVYRKQGDDDPMRVLVFHQKISPNERWKKLGVTEPFDMYLVMEAWRSQEGAARAMVRNLRQDKGRRIELDDGTTLDTGQAQATGYFGHNFFYDYAGFEWSGLDRISGAVERATGVFSVGCKTARVPGFGRLITPNAFALLYSRSLMASEGYSTLALVDAVARALGSEQMVRLADRSYRYFQKLAKPKRRVGRPFVGHNFRMYD